MTKADYIRELGNSSVLNYYKVSELKEIYTLKQQGKNIDKYLQQVHRIDKRSSLYEDLESKGIKVKNKDNVQLNILSYLASNSNEIEPYYLELNLTRFNQIEQLVNTVNWLKSGISKSRVYEYMNVPYSQQVRDFLNNYSYSKYKDYLLYGKSFYNYCQLCIKTGLDFISNIEASKMMHIDESYITLKNHPSAKKSVNSDMYRNYMQPIAKRYYKRIPYHFSVQSKLILVECLQLIYDGNNSKIVEHLQEDTIIKQAINSNDQLIKYVYCLLDNFEYKFYTSLHLSKSELLSVIDSYYESLQNREDLSQKLIGLNRGGIL